MEFGIRKCGRLILKRGKIVRRQGIEPSNGETMKELDKITEDEMKETIRV